MDSTSSSHHLFLLSFLSLHFVCSSSGSPMELLKTPHKLRRYHHHHHHTTTINTIRHDFLNPPMTAFPTTPVTNPVTTPSTGMGGMLPFPPVTPTPTIVTVPSTTPATNPVMNPPAVTNPVTSPTPMGGGALPAVLGQSWCVARGGVPDTAIQAALDYACGIGGADCSAIQQGASCYNPNTLQYHASYAFNSYYQRNPVPTSCDFGGTATVTNVNPSTGSCIFTMWSPSTTTTIPMPTPTTDSSTGATPTSSGIPQPPVLNAGNPAALGGGTAGGYGENYPPIGNSSSISASTTLRPLISCIVVSAASMIAARINSLGV